MRYYKITAPSQDYHGSVGGVGFHKGVARVAEDEAGTALDYFRRKGYDIEVIEETAVEEPEKPAEKPADGDGGGDEGDGGGEETKPAQPAATPASTSRKAR
ncbi:hypothetical protein HII36_29765 [Nonomuraea sp. NN258]|uniref:hypothetical protein n=1 Tax=Nonomuraea antri TaxID=2730852 RepID=UPI0015691263|nr:hypothetical protein [Nonomuraea antri]NRQ35988.1 hypothetical protein [Nonomuraea antri]